MRMHRSTCRTLLVACAAFLLGVSPWFISMYTKNTVARSAESKTSHCNITTRQVVKERCMSLSAPDKLPLQRDIREIQDPNFRIRSGSDNITLCAQKQLSGDGMSRTFPLDFPLTVHYVWCGKKYFRFEDYLGILSILRVIQPQKLVFHYRDLPQTDEQWYHTWFQELIQSCGVLELRQTSENLECSTSKPLDYGLLQLANTLGGAWLIGERTIITHVSQKWSTVDSFAYLPSFGEKAKSQPFYIILKKSESNAKTLMDIKERETCISDGEFNSKILISSFSSNHSKSEQCMFVNPCVYLEHNIYPKDVMNSTEPLSILGRWFYYGQVEPAIAQPGPDREEDLIPNILHMFYLKKNSSHGGSTLDMPFNLYMSMLSALYIANFDRVYIYGNVQPSGHWWDKLKGETKINVVLMEIFTTVFQCPVRSAQHKSDILRAVTLLNYGGVYQDWDVMWVNPIPREVRRYSTVGSMDWPVYGEWPEAFNFGVMMAKPGAPFLRRFLNTFKACDENRWIFNALLMPYKVYEQYPQSLYIYRQLQVICFSGICHPTWHKDYIRPLGDRRPTEPFDFAEISALHFSFPDAPDSLTSVAKIKSGTDVFADLGRRILNNSGRTHELDSV